MEHSVECRFCSDDDETTRFFAAHEVEGMRPVAFFGGGEGSIFLRENIILLFV